MALYGKLALLLIKQLSKPLASRIKLHAAEHSKTRAALVSMAQVGVSLPPLPACAVGRSQH
jgi:hypothetical protein